ncbi:hypothetical protein [Arthrobacter silvisoli]|uniref:hypothetical protein n=1 Tax=Arthrobacter silvisoli TaxID=2291022 RepID=UPI000E212633|nr:hypothetical protein [Arthrobacter silvisoli]
MEPHTHDEGTAGVLAALAFIDNVGFHGIATNLTGPAPKIDRNWAALIKNARIAVAATTWPDGLDPQVQAFLGASAKLVAALELRDTEATKGPAGELHISYHALSDAGWQHLAEAAGLAAEGHKGHEGHEGHGHAHEEHGHAHHHH